MTAFQTEIVEGVNIPSPTRVVSIVKSKYQLRELKPNQAKIFTLSGAEELTEEEIAKYTKKLAVSLRTSASSLTKRQGMKFTVRVLGPGKVGIWRIA